MAFTGMSQAEEPVRFCADTHDAQIDLNGDNLPERIAKRGGCADGALCAFDISVQTPSQESLSLGSIRAYHLSLGSDHTNGVRSIYAYDDASNDYRYSVYRWDASQSLYVKEETP